MNDNESGWSPIRQYAHDDAGWFSSMCEEALIFKKWQFLYFKPIMLAILVTIATGKSKINARILHLGYSSTKPIRWNWWKATFSFWL